MAFRPNASVVNEEGEKADQREARREGGDLRWYNFKKGQDANILRFLPPGPDQERAPYIPRGALTLPIFKHQNIPGVPDLKLAKCVDVYRSHPEKGISCPVGDVLNEVYTYCTAHKIEKNDPRRDRFFGPEGGKTSYYLFKRAYTNCVDRQSTYYLDTTTKQLVPVQMGVVLPPHLVPAPMIIGLPLTVNDWLNKQWRSKLVGDYTDEERGFDITISITGQGLRTEYGMNTVPHPKPLHPDPAIRQLILNHMYNIGDIFRAPSAADMDKAKGLAALCRKFAIECGLIATSVQVPDTGGGGSGGGVAAPTNAGPAATNGNGTQTTEASAAAPAGTNGSSLLHTGPTGASLEQPTGSPVCFFNHIIGLRECVVCPWEASCMEGSDTLKIPIDQRQRMHETVAQQREASRAA